MHLELGLGCRWAMVVIVGSTLAHGSAASTADEVRLLIDEGRWPEAVEAGRELLGDAETRLGPEDVRTAEALDLVVQALLLDGRAPRPTTRAEAARAVALRRELHGEAEPLVAPSLDRLSQVLRQGGDLDGAAAAAERSLEVRRAGLPSRDPRLAASLLSLGDVRRSQGRPGEAVELLRQAAELLEASSAPPERTGHALSRLGLAHRDAGDLAASRDAHARAISLLVAGRGTGHPAVGRALSDQAITFLDAGDLGAAEAALRRSVQVLEEALGPDHPLLAFPLNNLGIVASLRDRPAECEALWRRALAGFRRSHGDDHPLVAALLSNLATLAHERRELDEAIRLATEALGVRRRGLGPEHPDVAVSLNNLGVYQAAAGRFAKARDLWAEALALRERALGPEHPSNVATLDNLALAARELGDFEESRRFAERAVRLLEKLEEADPVAVARARHSLGVALKELGDWETAEGEYTAALATLAAADRDRHRQAVLVRDLGTLAAARGDHAAARTWQERAIGLLAPLGESPDLARAQANLAGTLLELGDARHARQLARLAVDQQLRLIGERAPETAWGLSVLAASEHANGDTPAARELGARAHAASAATLGDRHPETLRQLAQLSRYDLAAGEAGSAWQRALACESGVRGALEEVLLGLPERQALSYAGERPDCLTAAFTLLARRDRVADPAAAWDAVIRSRALVLDAMARRLRESRTAGDSRAMELQGRLAAARRELARLAVRGPGADESTASHRRRLLRARSDKEELERELASAAGRTGDLARPEVGLDAVGRALPRDAALVAFVRHEFAGPASQAFTEGYIGFVLAGRDRAPEAVDLGSADEIDRAVSDWRAACSRPPEPPGTGPDAGVPACRTAGHRLRRLVWDPVAGPAGGADMVLLIPDGSLHLVSFAALPVDRARYLVDTGPTLHALTAERDLLGSRGPPGKGLLAVGGPEFDLREPAGGSMPPRLARALRQVAAFTPFRGGLSRCGSLQALRFGKLRHAEREAYEVLAAWKRRRARDARIGHGLRLSGAAATEPAFKRLAPGKRAIHVASHAFFLGPDCRAITGGRSFSVAGSDGSERRSSPESPFLRSGLAFAGANDRARAEGGGMDDGILTAEEVVALDLRGTEWVVLSACDTGLGDVRAGEGVLGLRRAFRLAGARTVIGSLWTVDDGSTRRWMRSLHEARARGSSTAEAVRSASLLELERRREEGLSTLPLHWGGFVATGDWR